MQDCSIAAAHVKWHRLVSDLINVCLFPSLPKVSTKPSGVRHSTGSAAGAVDLGASPVLLHLCHAGGFVKGVWRGQLWTCYCHTVYDSICIAVLTHGMVYVVSA